LLMSGCASSRNAKPGIVTSTTLITTIVHQLAGDRFAVTTISPAGLCPGQFDLKPSDVTAANLAKLLLTHGWEAWYSKLEKGIVPPGPRKVTLATKGNWMVPDVQKQAIDEIAGLLAETDPSLAKTLQKNSELAKVRVDTAAVAARAKLAGVQLPAAIASLHQAQLLGWFGFRVVATYGRAEDFTAQEMTRLARVALDSGVGIIVDNLQSGPNAGKPLAEALKVKHVTLTNFPLQDDYAQALLANASALAEVVR
jgi:zinc transport system substrate-binding protein